MIYNELILGKEDQRKQVMKSDLINFPYNCIGKIKIVLKDKNSQAGTGFLISRSLVLTAAHTFEGFSERLNAKEFQKITFTIFDECNKRALLNEYVIQDYCILLQFKTVQKNEWEPLKQKLYNATSKAKQQQINKQMEPILQKTARYDFALLRLSEDIHRDQYFQLYQNVQSQLEVTVCGFGIKSQNLMFHSNKINLIKDKILYYKIDTQSGQSGSPTQLQQLFKLSSL